MKEGYAVTISHWGDEILTIEHTMVSGKDLSADDEEAIRSAAEHLRSFVGDGKPKSCFICGEVEQCKPWCPLLCDRSNF